MADLTRLSAGRPRRLDLSEVRRSCAWPMAPGGRNGSEWDRIDLRLHLEALGESHCGDAARATLVKYAERVGAGSATTPSLA